MNYGIAILPSEDVKEFANSYRKRYDPHYKLISPHITLKEAFTIVEEKLPILIAELEEVAKSTPSFKVTISKFSTFYPVNNVIYLAIDNNEAIFDLYHKIQQKEPDPEKPYTFTPHITIAQKMNADELLDVYSAIKSQEFHAEFEVKEFHLFEQDEDKVWHIKHTFRLA